MLGKKFFVFGLIYILLFFPLSANANAGSNKLLGVDCKEVDKEPTGDNVVKITYMGSDSAPYGVAATQMAQTFANIVYHHPGSTNCEPTHMVRYGQIVDASRGGASFGYHFYIAQNGDIYQGAPINKRTNHVSSSGVRPTFQGGNVNNANAIGITLMCSEKVATGPQLEASTKLGNAIQVAYNIGSNRIFGHGEIQTSRMLSEGAQAKAATMRSQAKSPVVIWYKINGGKNVVCNINGTVPQACTGDFCGSLTPGSQFSNAPTNPNAFSSPNGTISDGQAYGYPLIRNNSYNNIGGTANPYSNPYSNPYLNPYLNQTQQPQAKCSDDTITQLKTTLSTNIYEYNKAYNSLPSWAVIENATSTTQQITVAKYSARVILQKITELKNCGLKVNITDRGVTRSF